MHLAETPEFLFASVLTIRSLLNVNYLTSTLVHAAVISEPNPSGEPWLSDEPFRDVYVQRKDFKGAFSKFKKGRLKVERREKSSWESRDVCRRVSWCADFPTTPCGRVGASLCRRSLALRFSTSSKPRRRRMVGVYDDQAVLGDGMTSFTCESRTPPPRPQLNDFPAAALTRPRERPPGPNWLDSVLLMVPRANVAKNSARLRITACHPASRGGQPDGWQRPGGGTHPDDLRWLRRISSSSTFNICRWSPEFFTLGGINK